MSADTYQYQDLAEGQIRLLSLRECPGSDVVDCDLFMVSSDDHVDYTALSYVWGNTNNTKPICPCGLTFQVTVNLEAALRSLRQIGRRCVLWINAICLYQDRYRSKCCRNLRFEPQFYEEGWFYVPNQKIYVLCLYNRNISVHRFLPLSYNSAFASPCPFFVLI
jgi:hypothetical protein